MPADQNGLMLSYIGVVSLLMQVQGPKMSYTNEAKNVLPILLRLCIPFLLKLAATLIIEDSFKHSYWLEILISQLECLKVSVV